MSEIKYKFQIGDHVKSAGLFYDAKFSGTIRSYGKNNMNDPCYSVEPDDPSWLLTHDADLYPRDNGLMSWAERFLELIEPAIPIVTCLYCGDIL